MRGQLWQECRKASCDNEPVCADCEYCEAHCGCPEDEKELSLPVLHRDDEVEHEPEEEPETGA
jgi:hypothetical protein